VRRTCYTLLPDRGERPLLGAPAVLRKLRSPAGGLPRAVPVPAIAGRSFLFICLAQPARAASRPGAQSRVLSRIRGSSALPVLPPAKVVSRSSLMESRRASRRREQNLLRSITVGLWAGTSPGQFLDLFLDSDCHRDSAFRQISEGLEMDGVLGGIFRNATVRGSFLLEMDSTFSLFRPLGVLNLLVFTLHDAIFCK
jgi:hypothetical protein